MPQVADEVLDSGGDTAEGGALRPSNGYSSAMRKSTLLTLLVAAAFAAFLFYSTLSSQRAECTVTVEFQGRSNQATASGATAKEAEQQARTTACGPIAHGMDETIACTNRPPVRRECRTL